VTVTKSGRDDNGDCGSLARGRRNNGRNSRRGYRDSDDVWHARQIIVRPYRANSLNFVVVRIDEGNHARETGAAQVFEYGTPRGRLAGRGPDDGDRSRRKQCIEAIGRH
jgi:hypothetical protein